jgi:hypothetical protein
MHVNCGNDFRLAIPVIAAFYLVSNSPTDPNREPAGFPTHLKMLQQARCRSDHRCIVMIHARLAFKRIILVVTLAMTNLA